MGQFDQALAEFDERLKAKGYQPLEPFFVLHEKDIPDERTGGITRLDKARLERIVDTQNYRIASTGDATPIIIGHTKRHLSESQQPPLTGWATRYKVAPFFNTGKWGILATPWAKPHEAINFEKYPRRSCELWTDPDLIDPISLLGANTPRLDLGPHLLARGVTGYHLRTPLILEMAMADDTNGGPGSSGSPADGPNTQAAAGTQTDDFAQLKAQVADLMQMKDMLAPLLQELQQAGPETGAPPGGPPGGPMPPGAPPPGPMPMQAGMPPGSGTPPGGQNTMMPQQYNRNGQALQFQHVGYGNDGSPLFQQVAAPVQTQYPAVPQPLQFQANPLFAPPTPYQAPTPSPASEVEALRTQVASLQLARMGDEVTMILNDLEKKVVVDRAQDHARLIRLSKADRDKDIQFMLATRRPVEEQLPGEALPLQFHAVPNPLAQHQQAAPIQLGLGAGDGLYMPPDPNLGKPAAGRAANVHDALMEVVRNRGKLSNTQALDAALEAARSGGGSNGQPRVAIR